MKLLAKLTCEHITGRRFRPLFGREWTQEQLEAAIMQPGGGTRPEVQRRQDGDHFTLYWQEDGLRFALGLQQGVLIYASMYFEPGQLSIGEVFACLGAPDLYQAWCEIYPGYSMSSIQAALAFREQMAIAYAALHLSHALEDKPGINENMPVTHLAFFGRQWAEDERVLARERPWPGNWQGVEIDVTRHDIGPEEDFKNEDEEGTSVSDAGRPVEDVLELIEQAFTEAPRPPDDELLHPECYDDGDIRALYGVPRWRDLPEEFVEGEYAALFFLSAAGFRHFLPAYMSWTLRHPECGAAVVDHTIAGLTPQSGKLRDFSLSKFTLLDAAQRRAVLAFLEAMAPHADTRAGQRYWRAQIQNA